MRPPPPGSEHPGRLADRMAAARRGRFIGRQAELDVLRSALMAAEPSFAVLHISGPGGGKTTLLREYARIAAAFGRRVVYLDGRNIEPSPSGFLLAMRQAMAPNWSTSPSDLVWPDNVVLLIDTFEILAPLDAWLRESFLPDMPGQSLVVLAGRTPLAAEWQTDLDWAGLLDRNRRVAQPPAGGKPNLPGNP